MSCLQRSLFLPFKKSAIPQSLCALRTSGQVGDCPLHAHAGEDLGVWTFQQRWSWGAMQSQNGFQPWEGKQEGGVAEAKASRYSGAIASCNVSWATCTVSSIASGLLEPQSCHQGSEHFMFHRECWWAHVFLSLPRIPRSSCLCF